MQARIVDLKFSEDGLDFTVELLPETDVQHKQVEDLLKQSGVMVRTVQNQYPNKILLACSIHPDAEEPTETQEEPKPSAT